MKECARSEQVRLVDVPGISLRCAYCHDALARDDAAFCAACLTPHHAACFDEHGGCTLLGCDEREVMRRQARAPRARPWTWARRAGLGLGGALLFAVLLPQFLPARVDPRVGTISSPASPAVVAWAEAGEVRVPIGANAIAGLPVRITIVGDESGGCRIVDVTGRPLLVTGPGDRVRVFDLRGEAHDVTPCAQQRVVCTIDPSGAISFERR